MMATATVVAGSPLAAALKNALREAADLQAQVADMERRQVARAAAVTFETLERRGSDGKPLYGNEAIRKAAVEMAVAEDLDCAELAERLEELRCRRSYALAEAEGLKAAIRLAFGSMVQNVNGF